MPRLAPLLLLILALPTQAGQIVLRSSAVLDAPRAVLLSDVAELQGDDAAALATLTIIDQAELTRLTSGRGWAQVDPDRIREALKKADLPTGRIALSGSTCTIRLPVAPTVTAPVAPKVLPPKPQAQVVSLEGEPTFRTAVMQALLHHFDVEPQDLRLTFDPRDESFLNLPQNRLNLIARPLQAGASSTVGASGPAKTLVEVRVLEGDRQTACRTLPVGVEVHRTVLRLVADVPRRQMVTAEMLEEAQDWVTPGSAKGSLSAQDIVGSMARARLSKGAVLTPDMLVPASAVKRNDTLEVWVYKGGLAIKARATAMKDGAIGDVIPCRLDRSRAAFLVRLDADRRGVVVDGDPTP